MITHRPKFGSIWWFLFVSVFFFSFVLNDAKGESNDHHELSRAVNTLVSAWNDRNENLIAGLFVSDAIFIMPSGRETHTRLAIRNRLVEEWKGKLKDSALDHHLGSITIEPNSTAVVKGKYRLEGARILGIEKSPQGDFVFSFQKQNGRWLINKAELLRNSAE